jgi:hypothetical protein
MKSRPTKTREIDAPMGDQKENALENTPVLGLLEQSGPAYANKRHGYSASSQIPSNAADDA